MPFRLTAAAGCLRMAEGKMQTPNLDGAEVYLNNASLWRGTSVDEINRQKAEFIFTSIVGLTVNKKELLSFLDELLKFYRFVYSTITFGIFIPLVLNEFYNFFNLDGFCFFKIISLAFVLTFIPYYIALKKLYSVINLIKL